jgi:hypothetical protein
MPNLASYYKQTMQKEIKGIAIVSLTAVLLFSFVLLVPASAASQNGYVSYNVSVTTAKHSFSATVNETISSSSRSGFSDLSLALTSSMSNYSMSKLVNSTYAIFPYLPVSGNFSFSHQFRNYSLSVSLVKTGSGSATVSGSTYSTTLYNFTLSADKNGTTKTFTGQIATLPSGLVYSLDASGAKFSINAQLASTNLALGSGSSSSSTTLAIVGGTGTLAAGVGAFALFMKRKDRVMKSEDNDSKPLYHVD